MRHTPNILVFSNNYGAGHKMAAQSVVESLPECRVRVVDIFDEPLSSLDPLKNIYPKWSYSAIDNALIRNDYNRLFNLARIVFPKILTFQRHKIEKLLTDYISKNKPDMIISCITLLNSFLFTASQKCGIPFLIVTTDIDISDVCYGFKDDQYITEKRYFRITVPYSKETWNFGFCGHVPNSVKPSLQYGFGYPTRSAFSETFDKSLLDQLREEYQIQENDKIILVMAIQGAMSYADLVLNMKEKEIETIVGKNNKIRLICLCGDITQKANHDLMVRLNSLNKNKNNAHIIIHACPGTPRIAELVSLPELFCVISKPGGSTVNEMIKKKVPMIYHISNVPLDLERGNMEYGISRGLGRPFVINNGQTEDLVKVLTDMFKLHKDIYAGKKLIPEAALDFGQNLRSTITEMLGGIE